VGLVVNEPVFCDPEVASEPLQLPDAVHAVAFVELQLSVLLLPLLTDIGDAEIETVGGCVELPTVTVALADAVRPLPPVHVSVNVDVALRAPVPWLPDVALLPLHAPDAAHDAARDVDHVSVLLPPALTAPGLADSVTVGVRQLCACALEPMAEKRIASASSANRVVGFMGADHRHNAANSVCLQTATSSGQYSYLTSRDRRALSVDVFDAARDATNTSGTKNRDAPLSAHRILPQRRAVATSA